MHGGVSDTLVIVDALFAKPKPAPHTGQITRATFLSLASSIPTSLLRKITRHGLQSTGWDWFRPGANHPQIQLKWQQLAKLLPSPELSSNLGS